ncbi:MAG: HlyD family efflux transporter periplasmic adaptor subunit [Pseudomonadota bacterium]
MNIFRREALESQQTSWIGEIQLVRPLSLGLLTGTVALAVLAVGALLALGEYTRKVHVTGVLVPDRGVIRLVPPQDAVVLERRIAEGARVRAGDVLFVLSLDRAAAGGGTQAAVLRSLAERETSLRNAAAQQQVLLESQAAALDRRRTDLQRERVALDAEAALLAKRIALAEQAQARLESLRGDNFVSAAQVQAKAEDLLGLQAQRQAQERQRSAHERDIAALEAQRRELPLQAGARIGELERERAELAQKSAESEAQRSLVIRAPQDGVVSGLLASPGQTVTAASALASLVPAGSTLQAHLYAPSSAVGFLRAQQPVLLRYHAFAYQKFGHQQGRIEQVSLAPLQAAELAGQPWAGMAREPMYRITVALERQQMPAYGALQPLAPGMQLDADVPIERRKLYEWLFEPVLGVAGRV